MEALVAQLGAVGLGSGINVYLVALALGVAGRPEWITPIDHLSQPGVLAVLAAVPGRRSGAYPRS